MGVQDIRRGRFAAGEITARESVSVGAASQTVARTAKLALADAGSAGGVLAWLNPESGAIIVHHVILDVTTAAAGAATVDVGVAADGATASDNLIDGLDVNAATGVFGSADEGGTNGATSRKVAAGQFVTASQASGDVTGLAGSAYITYALA